MTRRLAIILIVGQIAFNLVVVANLFAQKAWQAEATDVMEQLLRDRSK